VPAVRVDGGDARAVYNATLRGRALALQHSCPVLIEVRAAFLRLHAPFCCCMHFLEASCALLEAAWASSCPLLICG
jgi:hypothetical protein